MKKLVTSYSISLPQLKLYLDDVEEIVGYLAEVSEGVRLSSREYQFEDVSDLMNLEAKKILELNINSYSPYIAVDLSPTGARVYISEDSAESRGVLDKIAKLCLDRRRIVAAFMSRKVWLAPLLAYPFLLASLVLLSNSSKDLLRIALGLGGVAIMLIWIAVSYTVDLRRYSIVVLSRSSEQKSFISRNSDAIVLALISALVGSGLTVVATRLLSP